VGDSTEHAGALQKRLLRLFTPKQHGTLVYRDGRRPPESRPRRGLCCRTHSAGSDQISRTSGGSSLRCRHKPAW
jgi:hypothetical protein